MAARARTTKSSFIRSGCLSISLSTVRMSCGLVMSFGGQANFIDRKSSKTPKTTPTHTPAAASRTGSVLPIFWRVSVSLSVSANSSHVLQSGTKKLALPRFSSVCTWLAGVRVVSASATIAKRRIPWSFFDALVGPKDRYTAFNQFAQARLQIQRWIG